MEDETRACEQHQEFREAQTDREGRVGGHILEEMRLRGERGEARDRELLEEQRRAEQQVHAGDGVRADHQYDERADDRSEREHVAAGGDDHGGVRACERQGQYETDDRAAIPARGVHVARRPGPRASLEHGAHRELTSSANWAATIAAAKVAATQGRRATRDPPMAPRPAQSTKRSTAKAV